MALEQNWDPMSGHMRKFVNDAESQTADGFCWIPVMSCLDVGGIEMPPTSCWISPVELQFVRWSMLRKLWLFLPVGELASLFTPLLTFSEASEAEDAKLISDIRSIVPSLTM